MWFNGYMRSRLLAAVLSVAALSGCVNDPCKEFATPADRLVLCPAPQPTAGLPTYCYRTLAAMQCYSTPQPGRELATMGTTP